jgi:hypothetical protein
MAQATDARIGLASFQNAFPGFVVAAIIDEQQLEVRRTVGAAWHIGSRRARDGAPYHDTSRRARDGAPCHESIQDAARERDNVWRFVEQGDYD